MSSATAILKTEIVRNLERLSEDGLDEVRSHVAALVAAAGRRGSGRKSPCRTSKTTARSGKKSHRKH